MQKGLLSLSFDLLGIFQKSYRCQWLFFWYFVENRSSTLNLSIWIILENKLEWHCCTRYHKSRSPGNRNPWKGGKKPLLLAVWSKLFWKVCQMASNCYCYSCLPADSEQSTPPCCSNFKLVFRLNWNPSRNTHLYRFCVRCGTQASHPLRCTWLKTGAHTAKFDDGAVSRT